VEADSLEQARSLADKDEGIDWEWSDDDEDLMEFYGIHFDPPVVREK
jgi:hypothetical protein